MKLSGDVSVNSNNPSYEDLYLHIAELEKEQERLKISSREDIKKCEAKFHAMLDAVDSHIFLVDKNLTILWANRKAKNMFSDDLVGKSCYSTCYGRKKPCTSASRCAVRQAFNKKKIRKQQINMIKENSKKMFFKRTAKVVSWDKEGWPATVIKIYDDITDRRHAEKKLKKSMLQLRNNLAGTIKAMAMTVETRDPYTAGHQRRTADIARGIAQEMGISGRQIDGIRMAGAIHDLGKISVPAEILSKPGKISVTEFSLIQNHPQTGYDILKGIDFKWPVAEIVRQHHERINGAGYPRSLCCHEILLEARIIGVADVIEAMSSHRPYRPALGLDKALDEIRGKSGILYDQDVVDAAIRFFDKGTYQFQ